ncbi:MAG: SiaB family protein kinase [Flavobacteriales bacterium]
MPDSFSIFDFYSDMEKKNVLLSFKGEINDDLVSAIAELVENNMVLKEELPKIRKKVFNILIECLQNLYHHNAHFNNDVNLDTSVVVMIAKNIEGYSIITGNLIDDVKVESFKEKLEEINALDKVGLKQLYKTVLTEGKFSDNGGAGLGLIDIGRKSGEPLEYGFIPFNENYSFFSLNIKINQ